MSDIQIRVEGSAGRITLNRPQALNALTYDMCMAIDAALRKWQHDDSVALIVLDAEGDKAFCAGGDIADLYATGRAGDFDYGRKFWRDEYRLNAMIFEYAKPVVSFLQGFVMGGGVGIGCHGTHRIVDDSARIAMPECNIGLIPDVGGTLMLALAPGRLGEYLGMTATRMGPGDAIYAGFADSYVPREHWPALIDNLTRCNSAAAVDAAVQAHSQTAPDSPLAAQQDEIDAHFGGETLRDIENALNASDSDFAAQALKALARSAPLSLACTVEALHRLRGPSLTMRKALEMEYRFTYRAMEHGDFLEGIRAQIIDKDRNPQWRYRDNPAPHVPALLMPLGDQALTFEQEETT